MKRYVYVTYCDTDQRGRVTGWGLAKTECGNTGLREPLGEPKYLAIRWRWQRYAEQAAHRLNQAQYAKRSRQQVSA